MSRPVLLNEQRGWPSAGRTRLSSHLRRAELPPGRQRNLDGSWPHRPARVSGYLG